MSWLFVCLFQCLDEVQSYILVERSHESNGLAIDSIAEEYLHVVSSIFAFAPLAFAVGFNKILEISCYFIFKCLCSGN